MGEMRKILVLAASLLISPLAFSRPTRPPSAAFSEPTAYGVVFHLNQNQLVPLEMRPAELETLHINAPVARESLSVPTEHSSVRLSGGGPLSFVVRYRMTVPNYPIWATPSLDPSGFALFRLRVEGARRLLVLAESTPVRSTVHSGLSLQVSPLGQDCLKLDLSQPLEPGEYAVIYGRNTNPCNLYCFGVDASPSACLP